MTALKVAGGIILSGTAAYIAGETSNVGLEFFCAMLSFFSGCGTIIYMIDEIDNYQRNKRNSK